MALTAKASIEIKAGVFTTVFIKQDKGRGTNI